MWDTGRCDTNDTGRVSDTWKRVRWALMEHNALDVALYHIMRARFFEVCMPDKVTEVNKEFEMFLNNAERPVRPAHSDISSESAATIDITTVDGDDSALDNDTNTWPARSDISPESATSSDEVSEN
eukprot:2566440-Pyramimonas_sp.AAC.1